MDHAVYHVLGFSAAFVSMLFELIYRIHGSGARVYIIRNTPGGAPLEYELADIQSTLTDHEEWDFSQTINPVLGVYRPDTKRAVLDFFETRYRIHKHDYARLVHPSAEIAATTRLGAGVSIQPMAVLAPHGIIGNLVTINRHVSVGHHTVIDDLCTLNPGVNIAGGCHLGEGVSVGMAANILEGLKIGANSIVGAGALVTKDIPSNVLAAGVPARVVRSLDTRVST